MVYEHETLQKLEEYFSELNQRRNRGVFFYRINDYSKEVEAFLCRYYEEARRCGVIIEGKIPNPDEKNLSYYNEMMGMEFRLDVGFIENSLKKWLPRMNDYQRKTVAQSIYDTLFSMQREGKTDNMLKNAYIKFMCWLYYKFERIVNQLGENKLPKILYEGDISNYEWKLICILAHAGCDVVLLQYHGDEAYKKLDPQSEYSRCYEQKEGKEFPKDFSLAWLRKKMEEQMVLQRLYGPLPKKTNCTNAWIEGRGWQDILKPVQTRGADERFFYNCLIRMNGVEDKATYLNELYQFWLELKNTGRKIVIVEKMIPQPSMEEIGSIKRSQYKNKEQLLLDLSANLKNPADVELQKMMNKAFVDVMSEVISEEDRNLNKLTNKAVYLLCFLKRYQSELFSGRKEGDISCFIYLGGCKNDNEVLFLKCLSKLPTDVLILNPDLNEKCQLKDASLYEKNEVNSLRIEHFPKDNSEIRMGTAAYHAERELDDMMYQDSGVYRNHQYSRSTTVSLQTMYEEISILWKEELKYRPNFSVVDGVVNQPVIFAKVCGVKNGMVSDYWKSIKNLVTEDTYVIKDVPWISSNEENPIRPYVTEFFKNRKLQKEKIRSHKAYAYGHLREEMQNHILDKLQLLIEEKLIVGTFENGTEYTIIATILNLKTEILRLLQKFDFTKKNPKLIYINTKEQMISLEDSILVAFLNLAGFDVLFFVPTGYQNVEKYFAQKIMEVHQIGEYVYDLTVPNLNLPHTKGRSPWGRLFQRNS